MARISAVLLVTTLFFGALPAMAADGNTWTCSLTRAIQCNPDDDECIETTIYEMALPRFVKIDLTSKTITSLDKEIPRSSKISSVERPEGLVIMHGTELRGWTMALGENSGVLTLSAAGESEGFVVFGSCITP